MKLKTFAILALAVLVTVIGTFAGWVLGRWSAYRRPSGPVTCAEADKLRWVEHANVQEDFRQHVDREHDMRFLHVYAFTFATEFPGLQDTPEMHRLVDQYGSRHIEGTGDVISCIEQHQLLAQVFQYTMRYNSMILGYRECQK